MNRGAGLSQLVVIVDDRAASGEALGKLAASLDGTRVRTFTDAPVALAFCAAQSPDLVVAKGNLPALEGAELVRRLHAQPSCAEVPVLVIGPSKDRALCWRALDAGA